MQPPVIAIVVPCYNEEEALPLTVNRLIGLLDAMIETSQVAAASYLLCSDDGSHDCTWAVISRLHADMPERVKGLRLAHNRGHQYALMAGLNTVRGHCDAAITIDADLQDDPEAIRDMVRLYTEGAEIVYGVRASRKADSWLKRTSAHTFYKMQRHAGVDMIYDHADYRLMSARAIDMLAEYGESNLYLRGIVPMLGLNTATVTYNRQERVAGKSKYPLKSSLSFSIDGITSFTSKPIRLIFLTGCLLLLADIAVAVYVLSAYFSGQSYSGWTSIMLSVWFLGSLMLISIGIVGEYIGKIFTEVKHRPRYAVRDMLWD